MTERLLLQLETEVGALVASHEVTTRARDLSRYADDPVGFAHDVLKIRLWSMQREIAEAVRDNEQVAVRSCNGAGKDFLAAVLACWWTYCRRGLVLSTSATERQVKSIFFGELHRLFSRAADLPGLLFELALKVRGEEAQGVLGFTSSESSRLSGFHAPRLLLIVSEAQGVDPAAWEGLMSNMTGEVSRVLAVGNPLVPSGRFFEICRSPAWRAFKIATTDCPNITGEMNVPGGVTQSFIDRMASEFGVGSSIYRSRVEAEFPTDAVEALVKRSWLEAAADRFEQGALDVGPPGAHWIAALDPSRYGADATALAVRQGPILRHLGTWSARDTMETAAHVVQELATLGAPLHDKASATPFGRQTSSLIVDEIGVGAGVFDRLREQGRPVEGFNGARTPVSSLAMQRFLNQRAESYWHIRQLLEANRIALPRHAQLFDELSATQWKVSSSGLIMLEAKDELSARLGRSPDCADAVSMVFKDFGRAGYRSYTASEYAVVKR